MENNQTQFNTITLEQKIGFVLLLIFGLLTVALGFLQMRNTIYNPFVAKYEDKENSYSAFLDDTTLLQQIDTDNDTLTDYEEFEFYKTSPYLPDTDSDGINDNVEIENGTDPLCPEGDDCEFLVEPEEEIKVESDLSKETNPLGALGVVSESLEETENETDYNFDLNNLNEMMSNPETLRELLISTGKISEEQLSQIDDETILELVNQISSGEVQDEN
jgi:hypothetical protein